MQRVRFITSTAGYARGAMVTLADAEAAKAIELGHAVKGEPIQSVGGPQKPGEPMARVIFLKLWKHDGKQWPKDSRATLPEKVAEAAIKAGAAKPFPVKSVGSAAPAEATTKPIRTGKREPITA